MAAGYAGLADAAAYVRTSVLALVQNSVVAQSIVGTSIAGTCMAAVYWTGNLAKAWAAGTLCTTFIVSGKSQPVLYAAVKRLMVRAPAMQMPVATAHLAQEETLTALQRFALLRRGLGLGRGKGGGTTATAPAPALVQYTVMPAELPMTYAFRGHTLLLAMDEGDQQIVIRVAGRGRHGLVRDFLQHVMDTCNDMGGPGGLGGLGARTGGSDGGLTCPAVYMAVPLDAAASHSSSVRMQWARVRELRARSRATVHLPAGLLDRLLADAEGFFTNADEYERRQQPYRRGWVLHGPPGTGKSTLPVVVATELGLPLCVLEIANPKLDDATLRTLLNTAPVPSLIVLEDVDAASASTHKRESSSVPGPHGPHTPQPPSTNTSTNSSGSVAAMLAHMTSGSGVTLAGLLNALDGLGAHEGHIVIMTTNDIQRLDGALLRPGRCDVEALVPLATRDQVVAMFKAEFPQACRAEVDLFLSVARPDRYSPAALCEYLMRVRGDLATAVSTASLATLRSSMVLSGAGPGAPGDGNAPFSSLFAALWERGVEAAFPWALHRGLEASKVKWELPRTSTAIGLLDASCAFFTGSYQNPIYLKWAAPLTSEDDITELFLGYFPAAQELAAAFGAKAMQWSRERGRFLTGYRVIRHLDVYKFSAEAACAAADQWLLTYSRKGANVLQPLAVEYVLYFLGRAARLSAEAFQATVDGLHARGITDASTLIDAPSGTSVGGIEIGIGKGGSGSGSGNGEGEGDGKGNLALELLHYRRCFWACTLKTAVSGDIATGFVNAYEDQGVDFVAANRAALSVTAEDGRSGFSMAMLNHLLATCGTMDECVAVMKGHQDRYKFPAIYRRRHGYGCC